MLDLRHECKMCTFGTGYPAVSREGENPTNALKNCAKTTAKINVRQASELTSFSTFVAATWNFTRIVLSPPYSREKALLSEPIFQASQKRSDTVGQPISTRYSRDCCVGFSRFLYLQQRNMRGTIFGTGCWPTVSPGLLRQECRRPCR